MTKPLSVTRKPSLDSWLLDAAPDLIPHREARDIYGDFVGSRREYLTRNNYKLNKSDIPTVSWTGSPARTGFLNACTNSTIGCRHVCIRYTGRLDIPQAQLAGMARTEFLRLHPSAAVSLIHWETVLASKRHERVGRRLNIVTDLRWDEWVPWLLSESPDNVDTYDYTKHWDRDPTPAERYRLTFSASEHHGPDDIRAKIGTGANVAVVFGVPKGYDYPTHWHGMPILDGDISDLRYDDPSGHIVALYAKGRARKMASGLDRFVKPIN